MPKISVLIPAYNVEKYIARCLDSVIAQTFRDIEIIIVNDGSTDGTAAIIDEYAARDSRIMVKSNPGNCGLLWTRHVGIDSSNGRYLLFLDSDDWITEDACEKLYSAAIESGADIVIADHDNTGKSGVCIPKHNVLKYGDTSSGLAMAIVSGDVYSYVWGKLYKRELFTDHRPPKILNHNYGEDLILLFHATRYANKVIAIEERLVRYYQNPNSVTHVLPTVRDAESDIVARKISLGYVAEMNESVKERMETTFINKLLSWIQKGMRPHTVRRLVRAHGLDYLLSFRCLQSHLGSLKAISYFLSTHTTIYPWLLYGRSWKR